MIASEKVQFGAVCAFCFLRQAALLALPAQERKFWTLFSQTMLTMLTVLTVLTTLTMLTQLLN